MKDPIQRTQLRTVQYDHVDGTPQLGFGFLCLLLALFYIIRSAFPAFFTSDFSNWLFLLVFLGGGPLIGWLTKLLKERITYPRTGYLAQRSEGRPMKRPTRLLIWIGVPLVTVIMLVLLFLNRQAFPTQEVESLPVWTAGFAGILFSGLWVIAAWKIALPRYYLVAVVSLLAGVALLFSGLDGYLGMALLFGAMSLALFLVGGVTLWKYLRDHPLPAESPDER